MARDSTRVLENAFGKDVPKGKKVVAHLHKRGDKLEKALADKVISLDLKLGRLQVLRTHSEVPAQEVDKLVKGFVAILSKIAKTAKDDPNYKWKISTNVLSSVRKLHQKTDKLLLTHASRRALLRIAKSSKSIPKRRPRK